MNKIQNKILANSTKKKLLLVSFDFYPDQTPNTYRWKNIIDIWSEKGIEVFVVSAQKSGFGKFEIINGIKIYRTGRSLFQKFKTKMGSSTSNSLKVSKKENVVVKESILRKVYNYIWINLYWPDWAFLSYYSTLSTSRKIIRNENITHLVSVSWPFTDHLVGYKLKKEFELIWLAEIIDPFSFNHEINNYKIYSKINHSVEKKILNKADVVCVMTQTIRDKYISLFPDLENKINIIHNVYVPENNPVTPHIPNFNKCIKLVFMGSLSPGVRTPEYLLKVFEKLLYTYPSTTVEIHFYGKIHSSIQSFNQYPELINTSLFLHGEVPKNQVNKILQDADILINIGNSNPYQEPSKIIEYVFLKKPIINICSIENDSSRELLDKYPLNINIYKTEIDNDTYIDKLVEFLNKNYSINNQLVQTILSPYLLNEVENKYYSLFWN